MPRRLPEPHSCMYCEGLGFNALSCPSSTDRKIDQWKQFASSEAAKTMEETPGLKEHLESQLRSIEVLCTAEWRQIHKYAADGCLFFAYVEEKTAKYDISEPRDQWPIKKFPEHLYSHSKHKISSDDERRFLIGVEYISPSEFRFRYLVHPQQVFHLIHFKSDASMFTSDDWVKIDPFQIILETSKRPGKKYILSVLLLFRQCRLTLRINRWTIQHSVRNQLRTRVWSFSCISQPTTGENYRTLSYR